MNSLNDTLKKNKIHVIIFAILLIYLFSADLIFNSLIPVKDEAVQYNFEIPHESSDLLLSVDAVEIINIEWKKVININGWALLPGENATTTKKYVVLFSENSTYIFGTSTFKRPDLVTLSSSDRTDYQDSGFDTIIPIYNIKSGRYRIGIILKNTSTSSFALSEQGITKINNTIIPIFLSEKTEPVLVKNKSNFMYAIDETRKTDVGDIKVLSIAGWAFVPANVVPVSNKYIILTSENATYLFDSRSISRPDVSLSFNDQTPNVADSGFYANIPLNTIRDGTYTIGIILQCNDYYYENISNVTISIP